MWTRWYGSRSNPWREFTEFKNRVNQLFREFDNEKSGWQRRTATSGPAVNLYDIGEGYMVRAMLPGFSEDDVKLAVNQQTLTISGERSQEVPEGYSVHRQERNNVSFSRSFSFPEELDVDNAMANFKNGLLTINLPKSPESRPRTIQITAE